MVQVLIVDDDSGLRGGLRDFLTQRGYEVTEAADGGEALVLIKERSIDAVLSDLKMPRLGGVDLLRQVRRAGLDTPVLLLTGFGSVEAAVQAMQEGAADFMAKPVAMQEVEVRLRKALERRQQSRHLQALEASNRDRFDCANIVGVHPAMHTIIETVGQIAPTDTTVLITGETGSGKELIAGAIHYASPRARHAFVKVNCAALTETLLESELFGHEKGAFTGADRQRVGRFEQADGGTLFLDEIADMSLVTQAKILRVLQEREFERVGGNRTIRADVRVIAATNKDLEDSVVDGRFREELYYRLRVITIHIPPLRERGEDIVLLAEHFFDRHARKYGKAVPSLSDDVKRHLMGYSWPGNVRELEHAVQRAVVLNRGDALRAEDFPLDNSIERKRQAGSFVLPEGGMPLEEVERQCLLQALERADWVQKDAARLVGISPRVMAYKVKQFGITHPRWRKNVSTPAPTPAV